MEIEFVEVLGGIRNDTGILGKGIIFNIILEDGTNFDCILFVHESINSFVSIHLEDEKFIGDIDLLEFIFKKYKLEDLLAL